MQALERINVHFSGDWSEEEKAEIFNKAPSLADMHCEGVLLFQDEKNVKPGGRKGYVLIKRKMPKTYIKYD